MTETNQEAAETQEVLVHFNVAAPSDLDRDAAAAYAVDLVLGLARDDEQAFRDAIALVDPQ